MARRMTQTRFEQLRDMLVEVETEFSDHCEACEQNDSMRPHQMENMAVAIRNFMNGELR